MINDPSAAAPRRDALRAAAGAAVFLGGGLAAGRVAAAGAKMSQKLVHYQTTPKGSAHCQACTQFLPSPACKLVDDPISANGWCTLYAAKAG